MDKESEHWNVFINLYSTMLLNWHYKLVIWHELTIHHMLWWSVLMCNTWDSKQYCSSVDVQYMNMVAVNINYIHILHPSNGCMQKCDGFFKFKGK